MPFINSKEADFWAYHIKLNTALLKEHHQNEANELLIDRSRIMYTLGNKAQDLSIQISVFHHISDRLETHKINNPKDKKIMGQSINAFLSNYDRLQRDPKDGMCVSFKTLLDARSTRVSGKKIVEVTEAFKKTMILTVLLPKINTYTEQASIKRFFRKEKGKGEVNLNKTEKISVLEKYIEDQLEELSNKQYAVMDEQVAEGMKIEEILAKIRYAKEDTEETINFSFSKVITDGNIFEIAEILNSDPEKANEKTISQTPLYCALHLGRYDIAVLLLACGAAGYYEKEAAPALSRASSTSEKEGEDSGSESDSIESLNSSNSSSNESVINEITFPSTHLMMKTFYEGKVHEQKTETSQGKELPSWNLIEDFYDLSKNELLRTHYLNRLEQHIYESEDKNDLMTIVVQMHLDFCNEIESKLGLERSSKPASIFITTLISHVESLDLATLKEHIESRREYAQEIKEKVGEQIHLLDIASRKAKQAFFNVPCNFPSPSSIGKHEHSYYPSN